MDYMLLKPVNVQFLVSVRTWKLWGLPDVIGGLALVIYGMTANGSLTPGNLALFAVLAVCGLVTLYAIAAIVAVTAFWSVQAGNAMFILYTLVGAGRFPVTVYPAYLRLFFTLVVPIAFVTTVPASAAVGRLGAPAQVAESVRVSKPARVSKPVRVSRPARASTPARVAMPARVSRPGRVAAAQPSRIPKPQPVTSVWIGLNSQPAELVEAARGKGNR